MENTLDHFNNQCDTGMYTLTNKNSGVLLFAKNIRLFVQKIHFFLTPDSYIFCCLQRLRLYSNLQTTLQV